MMKILQILILFTIINVIIGITNSEQTFGSKTNKLVSNQTNTVANPHVNTFTRQPCAVHAMTMTMTAKDVEDVP